MFPQTWSSSRLPGVEFCFDLDRRHPLVLDVADAKALAEILNRVKPAKYPG
jgi:hypothetical protein